MQNQLSLIYKKKPFDRIISTSTPYYKTPLGETYFGDALELMKEIPDNSINLVITSPPYALEFKKEYGNVDKDKYIHWFLPFAEQIKRILQKDGSFILNIGGSYNKGIPTKSVYHYKLLLSLIEKIELNLAQEFYWYNPAKLPMPAEWVSVRRIRVKDSVEHVWWLSKSAFPKADNTKVLKPYSADMIKLNKKKIQKTERPSGHRISSSFNRIDKGGAIAPNVFEDEVVTDFMKFGNNAANDIYIKKCKQNGIKPHPAKFPPYLPEFFLKFLTDEYDVVLDPFAGSNTTGFVAETLSRRWIAFDNNESYLEASKFRFETLL